MSKKVAVVCAAGKQGKLLVDEAVSRGYAVTGFVRGNAKVENVQAKTVVKDLFDLTKDDLSGFDVVIDAFGAWAPEVLPLHRTSLKHLCDILSGTDTRLLVGGGAGSLYVNKEHTLQVKNLDGGVKEYEKNVPEEAPNYPETFGYGWILPAKGIYFRYVDGLTLDNVTVQTERPDVREDFVFEQCENVKKI